MNRLLNMAGSDVRPMPTVLPAPVDMRLRTVGRALAYT